MSLEPVKWDDFVQRVRRHRPSDLLAAIAHANIKISPDGMWKPNGDRSLFPWALAVAARESIRAGNEHRSPGVTGRDLVDICRMYTNLYDPALDDHDGLAALVRIAFEQFPFQEPLFFAAARSRLLFEQVSAQAAAKLRIVGPSFWEQTIGQPLDLLFSAGMLFAVGALRNDGIFNLGWYRQKNFAGISQQVAEADARDLMIGLFATDVQTFMGMCVPAPAGGLERVTFNPLQARPFVAQGGDRFLAPIPQFVFWRASAPSLYYQALEHLTGSDRSAFTDDVGTLLEDYVQRQSEQLPLDLLLPAVEYESGKHTTDAILVWPDFVLLVEVKATRLTQESRMGGQSLRGDIARTIGRALEQVDRTGELIRARHPALSMVPADRATYGLVITLEPYYFMNMPVGQEELASRVAAVPAGTMSIQDFERFVADAIAEPLTDAIISPLVSPDRRFLAVDALLLQRGAKAYRNPLLDAEYNKLAFKQ